MNEYLLKEKSAIEVASPSIVRETQTRLSLQASQAAILEKSVAELLAVRTKLQIDGKLNELTFSPEVEALTQISKGIQARIVASTVVQSGENELVREDVFSSIDKVLHCLTAIQLQLHIDPSRLTQHDMIARRYNIRHTVNQYLNDTAQRLLNTDVDRWDQRGQTTVERWIPLKTVETKSATELVRLLIRSVPPNEQVDENFTTILYEFAKGIHLEWNPTIAQEQLLWNQIQEHTLDELVRSQEFRDRIGAVFAPYLEKLLKGQVETYEPVFHLAFESILKEVQRYYLRVNPSPSLTPTASANVAVSDQSSAPSIPIATTPNTVQQIRVTTQPQPTPQVTPSTAPTVDFRHSKEVTPPAQPAPAPEQSKIKPINLP